MLCLCAYELRTGRRIQLWEDQLGPTPPYRTDDRVLFVCFAATAECVCHLALGWPLPSNVLDLSPVFRCYINGRNAAGRRQGSDRRAEPFRSRHGRREVQGRDARAHPARPPFQPGGDRADPRILHERRRSGCRRCWSAAARSCYEPGHVLHWGEFAAVSAAMEHRGVPIDMEICEPVAGQGEPGHSSATPWCLRSTRNTASMCRAGRRLAFQRRRSSKRISSAPASTGRAHEAPASSTCAQDLRQHGQGASGDRSAAPAASRPQQDATDQAGGRQRRPKSDRAVAVRWKTSRTQPKASQWIFSRRPGCDP